PAHTLQPLFEFELGQRQDDGFYVSVACGRHDDRNDARLHVELIRTDLDGSPLNFSRLQRSLDRTIQSDAVDEFGNFLADSAVFRHPSQLSRSLAHPADLFLWP